MPGDAPVRRDLRHWLRSSLIAWIEEILDLKHLATQSKQGSTLGGRATQLRQPVKLIAHSCWQWNGMTRKSQKWQGGYSKFAEISSRERTRTISSWSMWWFLDAPSRTE